MSSSRTIYPASKYFKIYVLNSRPAHLATLANCPWMSCRNTRNIFLWGRDISTFCFKLRVLHTESIICMGLQGVEYCENVPSNPRYPVLELSRISKFCAHILRGASSSTKWAINECNAMKTVGRVGFRAKIHRVFCFWLIQHIWFPGTRGSRNRI